ncbi:MAG: hypothetical protein IPI10_19300 [Bacteroidetes bacterium]|nr:hypothetical protein [Bacteroidota bacterium]
MTEKEVSDFEKIQAQLESLHSEISTLTKKSSNDALNKFKLKFVNQTLDEANRILGKKYIPFSDFEKFDDNDLPTNSDVTMMLGQYLNCMEKFRSDNIYKENYGLTWYWKINGKESSIKTSPPKKLNNK